MSDQARPLDIYEYYTRLEPNHEVLVDDDGHQIVACPFRNPDTSDPFFTTWSPNAGPDEVNCLFCEWLQDPVELPNCPDGDTEIPTPRSAPRDLPMWDDYAPCKVPLRRIFCFDVWMNVHEGIVGDCFEAERRWRRLGGRDFYKIEQHHTGAYACRGSKAHDRALAIDFNWTRQPMVSKRTPCPADPQMPEFYDRCWRPLGYGSGLYWRSKCDGMHVSKIPSEGGDGVLYRSWPDDEEDSMALIFENVEEFKNAVREVMDEEPSQRKPKGTRYLTKLIHSMLGYNAGGQTFPFFASRIDRLERVAGAIADKVGVERDEHGEPVG